MRTVIFALAMLAASLPAASITIRGTQSCGTWIEERTKGTSIKFEEIWLTGYLSGIAIATDIDFIKGTDNPSVFLWMDNYCRANPLNDIAAGANNLFLELKKQKGL